MARFDIFIDAAEDVEYLLDMQSGFHSFLRTRIVIPIRSRKYFGNIIPRLHVPITIQGKEYFVATDIMTVVPVGQLGRRVGRADEIEYEITAAVDFLLQGF